MGLEKVVEQEHSNGFLSKFFKSKIGKVFLPLTLSSSLFFSSCASTSQYYDYREEPGTETKNEIILNEESVGREIRYDIQQEKVSLEDVNIVKIPVVEARYEKKTVEKRIIKKARFDEYRFVVTEKSTAGTTIGMGFLSALGFGFLGGLIGSAVSKGGSEGNNNSEDKSSYANEGVYIGAGVGFMVGLIAGSVGEDYKRRETNEYRTGRSEIRTLDDRIVIGNEDVLVSSTVVRGLKLGLGGGGIGFRNKFIYTNQEGIAHAVIIQLPFDYAFSDRILIGKMRLWDKVKGLPSSLRNNLIAMIGDKIYNSSLTMSVETLGEKQKGGIVSNSREAVSIPVRHIKENDVYGVMDALLREREEQKEEERQARIMKIVREFNSHIRVFTVYVEDKESHVGIPADITITSYAPSAQSFLDDHLGGEDLRDALFEVRYYPSNGQSVTRNAHDEKTSFDLYVPAKYHIKVINPDYHFIEGDFRLEANDLDRRVRMVEKGIKVKIGLFGGGGIE